MRTSRTTSLIVDASDKTIYPKCTLKKEHQKESMNMVCLTKTCKFHGPICALCKKQHTGHNVVSIKSFLSSIEQSHNKIVHQQNKIKQQPNKIQEKLQIEQSPLKKSLLQRLQQSHNETMSMLNLQVQQLSQQIRKTQSNLIKEFQQAKKSLIQETMKQQILADTMIFLQSKKFQDSLQFRKNINTILKLVAINKNQFKIQTKQEEIVKNYEKKMEICKENLLFTTLQIKQLYSTLHDQFMREKHQKISQIIRPKTAIVGSTIKPQNAIFSRTLKASNIVVEKDGKWAKLKDNNGNKFIFLHNLISSKIFQTTIKIISQSQTIIIGAALKDKIKLKDYKLQKNSNHGLFAISSNGFRFNYTQKIEDLTQTGFTFTKGDQITITLKLQQQKQMAFYCKSSKKKVEINLSSLPDSSMKQLQFCVILGSMGDKVQVL